MLNSFTIQGLMLCAAIAFALSTAASAARVSDVQLNREWAENAFSKAKNADLPFSFVYGGRPSSEIIGSWKRTISEKKLTSTSRQRTLTLQDPATGLEVRAIAKVYTDTPGVDWTIYFTNKGKTDTPIIEQVKAVDTLFPVAADDRPVLHRMKGSTCTPEDFSPIDERLPLGKSIEFGAENGRSSAELPFFNVQYSGGGVVAAIGWSGQWRATVERQSSGISLRSGMEFLHTTLHPGESIRSPRVMLLFWQGADEFTGCNLFRQTMLAHILPRVKGKIVTTVISNNTAGIGTEKPGLFWSYYANWTEAQAFDELKAAEGLGLEYFWVDAYFTRNNFPDGIGNYGLPFDEIVPDPVRWPNGLKPLSEAARKQGLKFLLWFEPERVADGTYIAKNHPEWVIFDPVARQGSAGKFHYNLFDLGNPEAREYMTNFLKVAIRELNIECLRIDFNIDPLPLWQIKNAKDPNRVGISEIRYNEGNYRMWDDLLAAFPNLIIDNCASGGRRIDLETCARSVPLWRTDAQSQPSIALDYNQSSLQNQAMSAALNRYLPFSTSGQIVRTPYDFRSGYNGGIVIWNIPSEEVRDTLKAGVVEGKRIRRYWFGNYYPISKVTLSPKDWLVTQYHLPESGEGLIVAFRRQESEKDTFQCNLREIDPTANYIVTRSYGFTPDPAVTMTGVELARLVVEIGERPGSVVVEYKRLGSE